MRETTFFEKFIMFIITVLLLLGILFVTTLKLDTVNTKLDSLLQEKKILIDNNDTIIVWDKYIEDTLIIIDIKGKETLIINKQCR